MTDEVSGVLFRDFMDNTMEKTNKLLAFLYPIMSKADPELQEFMIRFVLPIPTSPVGHFSSKLHQHSHNIFVLCTSFLGESRGTEQK